MKFEPLSLQLQHSSALLEGLSEPFFAVDGQWRFVYVNRQAAEVIGAAPLELLGRQLWDCFSAELEPALAAGYRQVMQTRQAQQFELDIPALGGRVEVRAFPYVDGIAVHVRDIPSREVGHRSMPREDAAEGVTELRELRITLEQRVAARTAELVRRNEELAAETAALQAFANFTELAGSETSLEVLTQAAVRVLHRALGEGSTGYYAREGNFWKQRVWDGNMDPGTVTAAEAGFAADLPLFAWPATSGEALFVDEWRSSDHLLAAHTPEYGAVAIYPVTVQGQTVGQLAAGLREKTRWSGRDRAVFRAVGRALSLAAERADLTRTLSFQAEELAARNAVLEAFAELGRDLSLHRDPLQLVRRAQELILGLLPGGYVVYAEPEGDRWRFRVHGGDLESAGLQAAVDAGLPFEETQHFRTPWQTGQPFYQDSCDPDTDGLEAFTTAATLPVVVNSVPYGVLAVGRFERRPWTRTDRVFLETVVRSLGLALERAADARALAEKQLQLEQANRDLEAFASSASHDLRAPVRHIASFAGMLRRVIADEPRARRYVDIIEQSAGRMNMLIEGLLTFSRLGSGELQKSDVALSRLVDEVRAELASEADGRRIEWRVGDLPEVRGDAVLLRQVVQNLLSNALKYSRPRETAVIEVWAESAGHEQRIHVRDNGVGFDPACADKLFEVFKRLHRPEEFEGHGVGLASVQRIVARHGGRVWAEGQPGQGATFTFTLPV
ncbi:MAG: ATP-binding protein [Deinococcota bacterium]